MLFAFNGHEVEVVQDAESSVGRWWRCLHSNV